MKGVAYDVLMSNAVRMEPSPSEFLVSMALLLASRYTMTKFLN